MGYKCTRNMAPFFHGPYHLCCLAIHFCILLNILIFFMLSSVSRTGNLDTNWWFLRTLFQPRHTCPLTIYVLFHFCLDGRKALSSQLKFIFFISFSIHFLFPCHQNAEKIIQCFCYRPSFSLPFFTLPYFRNH